MNAGRELDALVAEKVMGWVWMKEVSTIFLFERTLLPPLFESKVDHSGDDAFIIMPEIPDYSTDIAEAWEVVEKLKHLAFNVHHRYNTGVWTAYFTDGEELFACAEDITGEAPLAICLAALKAVGYEVTP